MENTYWNGKGKYKELGDRLHDLIPQEGSVPNPKKNKALEKLRRATNCYYDMYNNGLCNRRAEFRRVFGFSGPSYDSHVPEYVQEKLEAKMDEFILAAAKEQNVVVEDYAI